MLSRLAEEIALRGHRKRTARAAGLFFAPLAFSAQRMADASIIDPNIPNHAKLFVPPQDPAGASFFRLDYHRMDGKAKLS